MNVRESSLQYPVSRALTAAATAADVTAVGLQIRLTLGFIFAK